MRDEHAVPARLNHFLDLQGLFKMVQLVLANPPFGRFHQQFRIVIPVGEKRIKRQADGRAFLRNFFIAHRDDFLSQRFSHIPFIFMLHGWAGIYHRNTGCNTGP
jgi:hypothetical protein